MELNLVGKMKDGTRIPEEILQNAEWYVSNESIAKIENGKLIPLQLGTVIVTVVLNNFTAQAEVVISDIYSNLYVERIIVIPSEITIELGSVIHINSNVNRIELSNVFITAELGTVINVNEVTE